MIKKILFAIICLTVGVSFADSDDMPPHYRTECVACHERMVSGNTKILYTRKDRLAEDYEGLEQRVHYCQDQLKLEWNERQIRSVVEYLAKNYYRYSAHR